MASDDPISETDLSAVLPHRWSRFVALGDSFTEGIGDPEPAVPGGHRGWADRVAEVLSRDVEGFSYANLAVRGKLLAQIVDTQVEPARALRPDLISISAGGNDIIRPGTDPDVIASKLDGAVRSLAATGATVLLFTGVDVGFSPVFRGIRGKVAIFNEHIRHIAARHDCLVADQWAYTDIQDARMWSPDRLHLNSLGHHLVARLVLDTLDVSHDMEDLIPEPVPQQSWRRARADDLVWAREHLVPWILRRVRGRSSGDFASAKRPDAEPWQRGETPHGEGHHDTRREDPSTRSSTDPSD